jgi:hypothetical protein
MVDIGGKPATTGPFDARASLLSGLKGMTMRFILLAAMLLTVALPARAQDIQVERVDIVDKGIYTLTTGGQTTDANTPTGAISGVTTVKNIEATTAIPGRLGLEFGLQYVVVGEPAGAEVSLDIVITYPAPGLVDPSDPKPILESRFSRVKKIGETVYLGYGFENAWEIVPGTWKFEIWFDDRKLAEQTFTVNK